MRRTQRQSLPCRQVTAFCSIQMAFLEAENAAGQAYGDVALEKFIEVRQDLAAERFVELLLREVLDWSRESGQPGQLDDITLVVIDVK